MRSTAALRVLAAAAWAMGCTKDDPIPTPMITTGTTTATSTGTTGPAGGPPEASIDFCAQFPSSQTCLKETAPNGFRCLWEDVDRVSISDAVCRREKHGPGLCVAASAGSGVDGCTPNPDCPDLKMAMFRMIDGQFILAERCGGIPLLEWEQCMFAGMDPQECHCLCLDNPPPSADSE